MIAIGYVLLYFVNNGELPWDNCAKGKETIRMKQKLDLDALIQNKATCVKDYCKEVNNLKFDEKPNYLRLKQHFLNHLQNYNARDPLKVLPDWHT